ncbi:hypothetical protein C1H46_039659 [Malus baccata]|uniref:Uncharacterized protein n=1 Tax=Malus baccata TaxID=106549 RepID=A0A540KLD1_MALBA|nr:hypothetical protein C1H46_039659 [Malus baccata]
MEKSIGRQFRETQSKIIDYNFGRLSCYMDPRFLLDAGRMSLDAGRMSFDDPRYSFDEPRASWDGYLIGRTFPRMPTMLSVVEDAPVVHVERCDPQILIEELPMNSIEEETVLGLLITYVALNLMDGHGQPALLYIVPFTRGTLLTLGKKRGDLQILWSRREPEWPCPHIELEGSHEGNE